MTDQNPKKDERAEQYTEHQPDDIKKLPFSQYLEFKVEGWTSSDPVFHEREKSIEAMYCGWRIHIYKDPKDSKKTVFVVGNPSPVENPWNNQAYMVRLMENDAVMPYLSVHDCQFRNAVFLINVAIANGADFIEFDHESHPQMLHAAYCYAKYSRVDSTLDYAINPKQNTELVTEFKTLERDWKEFFDANQSPAVEKKT